MLVGDIMSSPVVRIQAEATLEDACLLMHRHGIRHLPVLEGRRLAGVVTDRDLYGATSVLCTRPRGMRGLVREAMSSPVRTATSRDRVEEAAQAMRGLKIGCLPVAEDGVLLGIVTGPDLLDALLRLAGTTVPGSRLEVRLSPRPGELTRLNAVLAGSQAGVRSVLTFPDEEGAALHTVLRLETTDAQAAARILREAGFDVVWPPERRRPV